MNAERERKLKPETIAVSGGHVPDSDTGSRAVPIYQTTSFLFRDAGHAARLFSLDEPGNIYTRLMNPTTDVFEKRMALLHGAPAALAVASGQAAISIALLNIASSGDEIVSSSGLYGGTHTLFAHTFKRMGINVRFCAPDNVDAFKKAIGPKTKALYTESIGNPGLDVADIQALAAVAHEAGVPLVIDNTVSPYLLNPIDHGADVVVYSATKFIGGHGTSIGGVIVDSGRFEWTRDKFPTIAGPDESYHGVDFAEKFGPAAYILKARVCLLRDLGPALSPFNAFLLIQGLETLHLRMPRHAENAIAVARHLENSPHTAWVNYPGLFSSPQKQRADKYLARGAGALIGFGIKGGAEAGEKFINSLELVSHLANIGDARSLAIHPASTTHQQLSPEEQADSGVSPDFIRLSIGIEHVDDIVADIDQALEKACS